MTDIYILHENADWLPPLNAAFAARQTPFVDWHMASGAFDLSAAPPEGVFYNRMSASSHTRGHLFAPELTVSVLAWLEAHGRRVVNGSHALDLEISKVRQYAALQAAGVKTPATRFASGTDAIVGAARDMGMPLVLKPNRGGKGLGVQLFEDLETLETFVRAPDFDAGRDGIVLLQQHIDAPDRTIVRAEFVGGKFLYAVRVDTSDGFELCPADACRVPGDDTAELRPMFEIVDGFADTAQGQTLIPKFERFLADSGIEIAGIEFITDADGTAWTYDVNTNTNYNPDAEKAAGIAESDRSGMGAVASYLIDLADAQAFTRVEGAA